MEWLIWLVVFVMLCAIFNLYSELESVKWWMESQTNKQNCAKGTHTWKMFDHRQDPYIGCKYCDVELHSHKENMR